MLSLNFPLSVDALLLAKGPFIDALPPEYGLESNVGFDRKFAGERSSKMTAQLKYLPLSHGGGNVCRVWVRFASIDSLPT